jgi:putative hydrolase of the HAD superfamily
VVAGSTEVVVDDGVVLWDFEGTLVEGPGHSSWSRCLFDVASEGAPELGVTLESMQAQRRLFPWHVEGGMHPELCDPDAWWRHVGALVRDIYIDVGAMVALARELEHEVRNRYRDPASYRVLADATPALEAMRSAGWRNVILSNHGPELPTIVEQLSIGPFIDHVFSSALTGFEKPNPQAFKTALAAIGYPHNVYMIGDNPTADIDGATAAGIAAILVHSPEDDSPTLLDATKQILTRAE